MVTTPDRVCNVKQQIGVVGMAVMGRNLALNIESRGYTVSVFNRSVKDRRSDLPRIPAKAGALLHGERVC